MLHLYTLAVMNRPCSPYYASNRQIDILRTVLCPLQGSCIFYTNFMQSIHEVMALVPRL
jgi:hypothetical protein